MFPAIRDQRIDFYFNGRKLFFYTNKGFKTNLKYIPIRYKKKKYVTVDDITNIEICKSFVDDYNVIKIKCNDHSKNEAYEVSKLYNKYSYMKNNSQNHVVILDIEIAFAESIEEDDGDRNVTQDRIDLLLFNIENKTMKFYEAKHYSNSEIISESDNAKVVEQINRYESRLSDLETEIIQEYKNYIKYINNLFGLNIINPEKLEKDVVLLIFGFDEDQRKGRLNKVINKISGKKYYPIGNIASIDRLSKMWDLRFKEVKENE